MTDGNTGGSAGIISWQLTGDGTVSTNDQGTVVVPVDMNFLAEAPWDLALDTNNFLYTVQQNANNNGPIYPLISYPPYEGFPETTPDWAIGMYPELTFVDGVAANPAGTLVVAAVQGSADSEAGKGGLYLFNAATGGFITNLDEAGGDTYFDAAWDNVGNLYAADGGNGGYLPVWHAYSPPGPNQATTVAVSFIQAYPALLPPTLASPAFATNHVSFILEGQSNVTYVIQHSRDMTNWTCVNTNFSTNDNRTICIPGNGTHCFFRAKTLP
jgi:hypothetical protein